MRRSWVVATLLVSAVAGADHGRMPDHAVAINGRELGARLAEMSKLLDEAAREHRPRRRDRLLAALQSELDGLKQVADRAPRVPPMPARPPPPPLPGTSQPLPPRPAIYPMDDQAFADLRRTIRRERSGFEQLRALESAASSNYFQVRQVTELLELFGSTKERLEAVRIVRRRIVDTENLERLYSAFSFPSEKNELKRILDS